jgi:sirohydrochlorin ferrochelatase
LYVAKSLDLRAAEGESPEIRAPEPEMLENYDFDFEIMPDRIGPFSATPIIMVNGSSDDVSVDITGFVIDGSSVAPENSEFGIDGMLYLRADGTIEGNEVKNIWGIRGRTAEGRIMWSGFAVFMFSDSDYPNNATIRRNNVHDYTGVESFGIYVMGKGCRATITENTVIGARSPEFPDQSGITVCDHATATLTSNIVSDCIYTKEFGYAVGIMFTDSNGTIQSNTLIDCGININSGFFSPHSTVSIKDNTVDAPGVHEADWGPLVGIELELYEKPIPWYEGEASITATIECNRLIGVSGISVPSTGICLMGNKNTSAGAITATITRNTVSGWDCGIELLKCSNSTVYLNDFVDNTQNVFVNESTNVYRSPEEIDYTYDGRDYTSYLGNYWHDYAGEDANADGIGDAPYDINSSDNYPLMERNENYEQIGILVVAHGSPRESWCKPVREAVESVSMGYPTEVGYLEFVSELEGYNFIHEAVDKLDEQGVTKIIAVPLFISSHSGHIGEIEYVLGLRETLPGASMMSSTLQETLPGTSVISRTRTFVEGVEMERSVISREGRYFVSYTPISGGVSATGVSVMQHGGEEEELVPVDTTAKIVLTGAIDNHTRIAQILADRAAELCVNPEHETVVFAAHGTDNETHFAGWVNSSESLAEKVKLILKYSKGMEIEDVRYSFVFANPMVHPDLVTRAVVEDVSATSYPIVVPLMVSEGFFTSTYIPFMELAGLDYGYPEKGKRALTPHPNVANWVEVTAAKELTYPTIPIYNDSQLLDITIEEVGAYHGDVCICLVLGYRGTQLAIADLWDVYEGEMPHQGDFEVIAASPTKGIRDAFRYIMNATGDDYVVDLPPGTNIKNLTQDNFRATIIRKSTGESVTIQVKEGVFPDGFFELRKKVKFGIPENATAEEKKAFKLLWTNTREKALYKPMDRVFEVSRPEKVGILAIAHGSSSESWCAPVRDAVENVSWPYPVELAFLEKVPNETVAIAVDKLDEERVTKIIAVPMFISSSSGHIAEIEYILGLRDTPPEGEEGLVQVNTTAEIVLISAMDNHSLIAQILTDRAAELCVNATNETVVIVAHGTKTNETQFEGWDGSSASLAEKVKLMLRHSKGIDIEDVRYSFINVNGTLHPDLGIRTVVEDVSTTSNPIVVPLMISEGYHTNRKIPKLLKNLSYAYPARGERALTPHDNVANWIEITAYKEFIEEFGYPTVQIYDGEELVDITIEDVGKYHGEGEIEICPCVVCAFRSTLRAFFEKELWDGVPRRGDVKIISAHPSDGHEMTFEYILNSTEDVVIQSPTDIKNITADNFVYTFINKTTNESITLRVKEDIFPERFFELRTKKKLGTATKEEKKALKLLRGKLKEKAMYKPMDRVFEIPASLDDYAEEEKPVNIHVNETGWWSEAVPEKSHFNDTPVQTAINDASEGEHYVF